MRPSRRIEPKASVSAIAQSIVPSSIMRIRRSNCGRNRLCTVSSGGSDTWLFATRLSVSSLMAVSIRAGKGTGSATTTSSWG